MAGPRDSLQDVLERLDGAPYARYRSLTGRPWPLRDGRDGDPCGTGRPTLRPALAVGGALPADAVRGPRPRRPRPPPGPRRVPGPLRPRGAGGRFRVDAGGQEVLQRSSCEVGLRRFRRPAVRLPAPRPAATHRRAQRGRRPRRDVARRRRRHVLGVDLDAARAFCNAVEDADHLRSQLPGLGSSRFVATARCCRGPAVSTTVPPPARVPFASPPSLRVEVDLPHRGATTGMGLPRG